MSGYFETRAAQDVAVMKLLTYIGTSKKCFSQDLLEALEPTDHEIMAAMSQGFVEVDWIDGKGGVYLRVSDEGRGWMGRSCPQSEYLGDSSYMCPQIWCLVTIESESSQHRSNWGRNRYDLGQKNLKFGANDKFLTKFI